MWFTPHLSPVSVSFHVWWNRPPDELAVRASIKLCECGAHISPAALSQQPTELLHFILTLKSLSFFMVKFSECGASDGHTFYQLCSRTIKQPCFLSGFRRACCRLNLYSSMLHAKMALKTVLSQHTNTVY